MLIYKNEGNRMEDVMMCSGIYRREVDEGYTRLVIVYKERVLGEGWLG